jgi:hypothetical protein
VELSTSGKDDDQTSAVKRKGAGSDGKALGRPWRGIFLDSAGHMVTSLILLKKLPLSFVGCLEYGVYLSLTCQACVGRC